MMDMGHFKATTTPRMATAGDQVLFSGDQRILSPDRYAHGRLGGEGSQVLSAHNC